MTIKNLLKTAGIKRLACIYFVGFAVINIIFTWYNVGVKWPDLITVLLAALPFIINKKIVYLLFGLFAAFVSSYLMFACLVYAFKNDYGSVSDAVLGVALTFITLLFSIGLMRVGMQSSDKDRFTLIEP